jgi:hypothetical protein
VGDKNFATKYAGNLSFCTGKRHKAYIDRSKNIWFVKSNNYELFILFKKVREDKKYLTQILSTTEKKSKLLFLEGLFDAEGCVKIIKEPVRITPKICLDVTNTDKRLLDAYRDVLLDTLELESRYSVQKADGKKNKKIAYHLRIYKKSSVKIFFENISTTKLKSEKALMLKNWLENGAKTSDSSSLPDAS